jgi:glycerophosphoryl diester phosphodiesterase
MSSLYRSLFIASFVWITAVEAPLAVMAAPPAPSSAPLTVAHRGASAYRPEHTLAAYELAIDQGADFIEPDLVSTKDGVLICRHDLDLGTTTDVEKKFPDRRRVITVGEKKYDGWFAFDFTLAEIKTLRAREPQELRAHAYDGLYEVPTFEEYLDLIERKSKELGRPIGIIPEIKASTYHRAQGVPIEDRLLKILSERGYPADDKPCIIQSFEIANLKQLAGKTKAPLLQLIGAPNERPLDVAAAGDDLTYGEMMKPTGLAEIAKYAWGVGPPKDAILPRDKQNRLTAENTWIRDAHAAGLKVIPFTFRPEPQTLAEDYHGDPAAELKRWIEMGVDGIFVDAPDFGVRTVRKTAK